jgi:hypothetical protein
MTYLSSIFSFIIAKMLLIHSIILSAFAPYMGLMLANVLLAILKVVVAVAFVFTAIAVQKSIITEKPAMLEFASATIKADKKVVLAAVEKNRLVLQFANIDVQKIIILENPSMLEFANIDVQKRIITEKPAMLKFASSALKADRDAVLAAVRQNGYALKWSSEGLKANRDVVLAAVGQYGWALCSASEDLTADRDVVLAAVGQDGQALKYASEDLTADRDVVLAAVGQDGWALESASKALQADRDVVLAAVRQCCWALYSASEDLRADREVVLAAVRQDGRALEFASSALKADQGMVLATKARSKYKHPNLAGSQRLKPQVQVISEFKEKTDSFRSDPSILNSLAQAPFRVFLREAMLLKACLGQPGVYLQMRTFLKIPTSKLPDEILD